jgi:hypothetical protein
MIAERDLQGIAEARPQRRRHRAAVVEHASEFAISEPNRSARRGEGGFQNAVAAANFRRRRQRLASLACGARQRSQSKQRRGLQHPRCQQLGAARRAQQQSAPVECRHANVRHDVCSSVRRLHCK